MGHYAEIKVMATVTKAKAQQIVNKGTVEMVISMEKIAPGAKELFDQAGIEYVENIPESEFMESNAKEIELSETE